MARAFFVFMQRYFHYNRSLPFIITRKKASTRPRHPVFLAFLGIPFLGKKGIEEEKIKKQSPVIKSIMSDFKVQLEKADEIFDDNKFKDAVDFLKALDQSNSEVQWRLARAIFKLSGEKGNEASSNEMIREAFKQISEALDQDENNFAIHKWYAILLDAKSNLDGMKERIQQLENVKKHMEKAIELNQNDPTSRYILGEFSFGLADLPWYQRKIVSTIFASPPTSSYDEALQHFLKAEELKKDFYSTNKLMIAKSYLALKNNEKAKEYLKMAVNIPVLNEDDRKCKEEAEKLLGKLK